MLTFINILLCIAIVVLIVDLLNTIGVSFSVKYNDRLTSNIYNMGKARELQNAFDSTTNDATNGVSVKANAELVTVLDKQLVQQNELDKLKVRIVELEGKISSEKFLVNERRNDLNVLERQLADNVNLLNG